MLIAFTALVVSLASVVVSVVALCVARDMSQTTRRTRSVPMEPDTYVWKVSRRKETR